MQAAQLAAGTCAHMWSGVPPATCARLSARVLPADSSRVQRVPSQQHLQSCF